MLVHQVSRRWTHRKGLGKYYGSTWSKSIHHGTTSTWNIQLIVSGEITDEQLEQAHAPCQLHHEQELQESANQGSTYAMESNDCNTKTVRPVLYTNALINGVPVHAMVDTGAQLVIISRSRNRIFRI